MRNEEPATPDSAERTNDKAADAGRHLKSILNRYLDRLESLEDCERLLVPAIGKFEIARAKAVMDRFGLSEGDVEKGQVQIQFRATVETYYELDRLQRESRKIGAALSIAQSSLFAYTFALYDALVA